jgi:hypothetical protein
MNTAIFLDTAPCTYFPLVRPLSHAMQSSKPMRVGAIPFLLPSKLYITGNLANGLFCPATCRTMVSRLPQFLPWTGRRYVPRKCQLTLRYIPRRRQHSYMVIISNYKLQIMQLTATRVSLTMLFTVRVFLTWWSGVDVIIGSISSKLPFREHRAGFLMRHPVVPPLKWRTFSRHVWVNNNNNNYYNDNNKIQQICLLKDWFLFIEYYQLVALFLALLYYLVLNDYPNYQCQIVVAMSYSFGVQIKILHTELRGT